MCLEYNSNNTLKIEYIFHIPKNKGKKKDEKVTFVLKNVPYCYFSIPIFLHIMSNKRFICINKTLCVCFW